MYGKLIPLIVSAFTVVVLGMWNPTFLQKKVNGKSTGCTDPIWLAVASLGVGALSGLGVCFIKSKGNRSIEYF